MVLLWLPSCANHAPQVVLETIDAQLITSLLVALPTATAPEADVAAATLQLELAPQVRLIPVEVASGFSVSHLFYARCRWCVCWCGGVGDPGLCARRAVVDGKSSPLL